MLTNQQMKIMEMLMKASKAMTASEINNLMKARNEEVFNIHEQLNRLVQSGYVVRVGKEYKVSSQAEALMKDKKADTASVAFSEEQMKSFNEFAKAKGALSRIVDKIAPNLVALEEAKLALLVSLVSLNDTASKNRIHVLMTGGTASGKTSLMRWFNENLWGIYAGPDTSNAGLLGRAAGNQFKPGLLNQANNSTLYLDEIDKMESWELDALLNAMQSGKVTINKDGVNKIMDTQVRVICACNNTNGFREEFMSRFDIELETNPPGKKEMEAMIRLQVNNWNREDDSVTEDFIKEYLTYVASYKTELPEDREWVSDTLIHEFNYGSLQGKDQRRITSIVRIGLAIARLQLKKVVDKEDIKKAIELIREK